MTECNRTPIHFSTHDRRHLHADFSGGVLTSDAGALLLREADRQLGLLDAFDRAIPDPRNPELIQHPQRALLAQRIFAIACGYEDLNDHQRLRHDPLWQTATDHPGADNEPALASPSTLCRLENRVDRHSLFRLASVLVEQFIDAHSTPPEELILDFDATDDPVHGHQENRFFHGYYDNYCFLPLYVFCGDHLLVAYLRPSNIDASKHSRAILKLLVRRLRQVWPSVRIVLRADSGFCRWRLMRWCDRHQVGYILGLAKNAVLVRLAADWQRQAEEAYRADPTTPQRVYGEFEYAAGSWDRPRRVLAKAEHLPGDKANPRFVVTNQGSTPQDLYERGYCPRGDAENRIKEQQLMLFADRTSCHAFVANQFRVLLAAAAYVLVSHVRRRALPGTELACAEVGTIRLRLFKVGAWVVRSVRRVVVRMSSSYPWQELFGTVAARLCGPRFVAEASSA
jgi:hypothetical protein